MSDAEIDDLLANAKPAHNKSLGFAWSNYGQFCTRAYYLPFALFCALRGGERYQQHYRCYPTEDAAMTALNMAVAKYKESRK